MEGQDRFCLLPMPFCSFSSTWKKANQKETPVSRGPYGAVLRVLVEAGARGNSPACGGLKQVRAFFCGPIADTRRGDKGKHAAASEIQHWTPTKFSLIPFSIMQEFSFHLDSHMSRCTLRPGRLSCVCKENGRRWPGSGPGPGLRRKSRRPCRSTGANRESSPRIRRRSAG